jgi:tetratricopeptide (TPR) repeat protein
MKLFSTPEVVKIVNLPDSRIRSFVRAGFLTPLRGKAGALQFTFRDLLFLKTAKGLLDSRVPHKRVLRILDSLKRQLPDERHFASVKIYADGRRVVVWDGKAQWQPDSGQFLFNFDARNVLRTLKLPTAPSDTVNRDARYWFELAAEVEKSSTEEACRAYLRAIELDPAMSDAHLNLGKLYHDAGRFKESETHYRAAAKHDRQSAAPFFNLGVLHEDFKQPQKAAQFYRQALDRDPNFADAHYNLGLLLERIGDKRTAFTHLRTARKLYTGK